MRLSAIILSFNSEKYLERSIQSLANALQALGDGEARVSLLAGAVAAFDNIIRQIDELNEWDVAQGIHHQLPGVLRAKLANLGTFEALDRKIEQEVKTLENAAVEKAGA